MGLTSPTVGIIGGTNGMGAWFADQLESLKIKVHRVGRKTKISPRQVPEICDVIVISVPIADTINMIEDIAPLVPEKKVLMDLTSTKKEPVEAMLKFSKCEVVGVHPLFGPNETSKDRIIAICHGRGEKGVEWITEVFKKAQIKTKIMSPKDHDRMMGLIQGVNHFHTLALAYCIKNSGFEFEEIKQYSTMTFKRRLDRITALVNQPSELFGSLLMDNVEAFEFIDLYKKSVEKILPIIYNRDKEGFQKFFESLK